MKEFYTLGHLLSSYSKIKSFAEENKQNSELYDFLNWDFEKDGFWGKLKNFQPDLLVLDLFPDIYFGSFRLKDGTLITRNFRLMGSIPENATPFNTSSENYVQQLMRQVQFFKEEVHSVAPGTKLIFNGARFPQHMSRDGEIKEEYDKNIYKLPVKKINGYNRNWGKVDRALIEDGFDVLKFDQKNSAAEINFPVGSHWYYLYNQNYYTDVQCQIETIAQKYNLGPTIIYLDIDQSIDLSNISQDVVMLNVPNPKKDLRVFRRNNRARNIALDLAGRDYVLHGNQGSYYRFVKRVQLKTKYPKFKDVHYRIIPPKENKKFWKNKLLVRMFSFSFEYSTSMIKRNFQTDFVTLKDSIVKDTYVLEIGDINLIAGSFYTNTRNYPDYEKQVQDLIKHIAQKYKIDRNNIVVYGASRGGAGALLHGALGDYKFVASDLVIDGTTWYFKSDEHYVGEIRDVDLTDTMANALTRYNRARSDAIVIGASNIGTTFSAHLRLPLNKITLLDLNIDLHKHTSFNRKTTPIQLSFINYLLIEDELKVVNNSNELPDGVVLELKHLAQNAINFEQLNTIRVKLSDIKNSDTSTYEKAMDNIKDKYKYVRTDKEFEYFELI